MNLVERSRRSLFITVGLGILAYSVAEANVGLGLAALGAWGASWVVTQGPKGRPLPRVVLLALVLGATAHVFASVLASPQDLVIAISRYLVALHVVKLYDRVSSRDQAQLIAMSIFLVIGACLTSNTLWLGLALAAYLPMLLRTIMLHQLASGQRRLQDDFDALRPSDRRRLRARVAAGRAMRRDFVALAWAGAVALAALAAVVFIVTPRQLGLPVAGEWGAPGVGAVTAFTDEVNLGAGGELSQSETPVLELRVTDSAGEEAGERLERILLRGAVLDAYANGQWRRSAESAERDERTAVLPNQPTRISLPGPESGAETYTQRITFRNKPQGPLFAMHRPLHFSHGAYSQARLNQNDQVFELLASGRISYTVVSQPDAPLRRDQAAQIQRMPAQFREGRIRELTDRVLAEVGLARDPEASWTEQDSAIAEAIEEHLQTEYGYTTQMTPPEPREEPIEMFLFRTRVGHCEYFASAMAAMCRSVGLDARVVTGYVAVERSDAGVYTVRESNAHAWVEARVAPNQWRTFDPSPPDDLAVEHAPPSGVWAALRSFYEGVERLWVRGVVGFDDSNREALIGAPSSAGALRRFAEGGGRGPFGGSARALLTRLFTAVAVGAGAFAVAAAVGFGAIRLHARIAEALGRRRAVAIASAGDPSLRERLQRAAFIDELFERLRRAGLARPAWRPALSHARSLGARDVALAESSSRLVELYYAARYGRRMLTDADQAEAASLLASIDERLREIARRAAERR